MGKKLKLEDFIKNLLEEGPLSYTEIITRTIASSEYVNVPKRDMSYNAIFNKLLKLKIIQIEEYELPKDWDPEAINAKRLQSMNIKNVIFSIVKTESLDIFNLIKQLDTENYNKAHKELKYLFKKKIKEFEAKNQNKWDSLVNQIVVRDLRDEELLQLEGETEALAFRIAQSELYNEQEQEIYGILEKTDQYQEKMPEIREKYKNTSAYFIKNPKTQKKDIPHYIKDIINTVVVLDPSDNPIRLIDEDKEYEDVYYVKKVSLDGKIDKEMYLESLGYVKPKNMDDRKIDNLFEDILFYINSQEPKNPAMHKLARALSNQDQSMVFLEEIISLATGNG
ncbi:hypothetical protein [Methanobacterium formicicum]|uniref:Uncharacterized protein n=1 Tax=Methanobacterium formicicum (strain DSM 3637 / PP1) TaxID=1204725 RepID=K2R5T3_METFP|nr:hypothetical protein [Methanobacterium formicicum]EKF86602.1 hypothetical protein A994_03938 [Methanobacterium formicicum DSM 3637]